jgi:hypothetical protein
MLLKIGVRGTLDGWTGVRGGQDSCGRLGRYGGSLGTARPSCGGTGRSRSSGRLGGTLGQRAAVVGRVSELPTLQGKP